MERKEFLDGLITQSRSAFPLFRYLLLQTETHAFCLALACAALIGFYPFCIFLLAVVKYTLKWTEAYNVLLMAIREYYPYPDFLIRNFDISLPLYGRHLGLSTIFWIVLGAAGVFIPLEAGFNRLWKVKADRPYVLNQLVGLGLTLACCVLAVAFVAITTTVQTSIHAPIHVIAGAIAHIGLPSVSGFFQKGAALLIKYSDKLTLKLLAVCFFSMAVFLFYKFLPNAKIRTMQVLPAALLAGVGCEIVIDVYRRILPLMDVKVTQGPFYISISFVLLAYIETFVVLGGAFLAAHAEEYSWLGSLWLRKKASPDIFNLKQPENPAQP
jgi:uncharacterized BrkB/YihY/UPF0761 family membrane protein